MRRLAMCKSVLQYVSKLDVMLVDKETKITEVQYICDFTCEKALNKQTE